MSGGLNIPDVVTKALPEASRATAYFRVRAGLDSLLGETHLLVIDGALAAVVQPSMLSAATPLGGPVRAELEIGSLRSMLRLAHAGGAGTVTLGYGEAEPVRALLDALAASAARAAEVPAIEVAEEEDEAPISEEEPAPAAPASPVLEPAAHAPATPDVPFTLPPFASPASPPPPFAPSLLGTLASRDVVARAELLSLLHQRAELLEDAERAEERGRAQQLAALARARRARDDEERRSRAAEAEKERAARAHRDEPAKPSRKARRKKKGADGGDIPVRADGTLVRSERAVHLQAELGKARGLPNAPTREGHRSPPPPPPRAPRSLRAPQEERRWVSVLVWIAFAVLSTMLGAAAYRSFVPAPLPDTSGDDDVRRLGPPSDAAR